MNIRRKRPVYDSPAEECRQRGIKVGDRLVGDEGYGPTIIEITAIGEKSILAKAVSHDGETVERNETLWTLNCRDWEKVSA
jgi:hypothetical protein